MKQDELRKQMLILSAKIESCHCPETKTLLLKRARVLLASVNQSKRSEAKARIDRLNANMPKVYRDNPHALVMIEERQPGYEKFLPYVSELEKGARMKNQIQALASQYEIGLSTKSTERKANKTHTRRKPSDKRLSSKTAKSFADKKFKNLSHLNSTIDNKDVSMETRRASTSGKKAFVNRETEFNGTRRNDKPSNDRMSWNEEGKPIARAKGSK